jgi:hypothetical protein
MIIQSPPKDSSYPRKTSIIVGTFGTGEDSRKFLKLRFGRADSLVRDDQGLERGIVASASTHSRQRRSFRFMRSNFVRLRAVGFFVGVKTGSF